MEKVIKYWFLVPIVFGIIMWYGNINYRLETVEAKISEQRTALEQLHEIKTDVEVIKSNVQFIKSQIQ